ncbi:hypothetical protein GAC87_08725 [Bacteroides thetaiotaomicron]|jgi:hypothetical protein|nr:hypothetical protein F1971_13105 [Akkermansia sp. BIOML-A40]KAA4618096.1 hypothetical protein F3B81_26295 [Bacteroides ovatus]KAB4490781.1 hypothetical protein GAN71_11980 [Bacteroides thetaiotaomicron]KAB4497099.1 hypothetical protein GAN60_10875 [Bacteroides thetaiotaomicron]KAB4501266.1 hypothetical protein GAN85_11670 [Bacteroides thetaiotaomicron]
MKTHNIILLILLFVCTNVLTSVLLAQDKEVNMVSKKAKLKTIKYKKYNYTAVGYVYKDRFVEGQKLSFIKTQTGDTIISGIYSISYGYPCIKGNYKGFVRMNNEVTSGLFIISNSIKTNQLIPVRKNVGKLKIRTLDILEHKDTYAEKYPLVFRKTSTNRYELKILFDDKTLEVVISPDTIKKYGFYAFDTFIENSKNVNLLYKNGDIYTGIVEKGDVTGSIYDIYFNKRIYVPSKGVTKFANGEILNGDWLKSYDFTEKDWRKIYAKSKTLTEIRDNVYRKKSELDKLKIAEERKRLEEQRIRERKRQEMLKAKERERQEKLREERVYRLRCISRYGEYYGNLILKKEFALGMNKEMVRELLGEAEKFYKKSISTFRGHTIESWVFDTSLVAQGMSFGGLLGALSYYSGIELERKCPTLVFTDDKITSIYR